jgi:hypothetical protein
MRKTIITFSILLVYSFHCLPQNKEALKDSITNLLVGEWGWYGSAGGHGNFGFGGPEDNGYTVSITLKPDHTSDSINYHIYINDSLEGEGKTLVRQKQEYPFLLEMNNVLPERHSVYFVNPMDSEKIINFQFLNKDSIRFYNDLCGDCEEVLYKRIKNTAIIRQNCTQSGIHFYPNPISDRLFVVTNQADKDVLDIEIYSLKGELIRKECIEFNSNTIQFNLSSLKAGSYVLRLLTGSRGLEEKVIIKK